MSIALWLTGTTALTRCHRSILIIRWEEGIEAIRVSTRNQNLTVTRGHCRECILDKLVLVNPFQECVTVKPYRFVTLTAMHTLRRLIHYRVLFERQNLSM